MVLWHLTLRLMIVILKILVRNILIDGLETTIVVLMASMLKINGLKHQVNSTIMIIMGNTYKINTSYYKKHPFYSNSFILLQLYTIKEIPLIKILLFYYSPRCCITIYWAFYYTFSTISSMYIFTIP